MCNGCNACNAVFRSFFYFLVLGLTPPHPNKKPYNPFKMRVFGAVFSIFFLIFAVRKG